VVVVSEYIIFIGMEIKEKGIGALFGGYYVVNITGTGE
jgi:hypothetical protein